MVCRLFPILIVNFYQLPLSVPEKIHPFGNFRIFITGRTVGKRPDAVYKIC
jgi:hypothetical protein